MSTTSEFTAGRENGHRRPRGYADWCPQRKTRQLLDQIDEVLVEYEDHLPLTIRQIFYRLVAAYGYDKTEKAYGRLGEHLNRARRARRIDFGAIRDDGVIRYFHEWHDGPADFWDEVGERIREYRRDRQAGQPQRLELWCEAAGMAPQLARVANPFSVPVYTSSGFQSLTAVRQVASRAIARTVPTVLLHVGDFDPSGESIFESLAEDAAAFVEADRQILTQKIIPVRVALTPEEIAEHRLPTAPPKKTDSRSHNWKGGTCQLEALAPDVLAEIVGEAITSRFDLDRLEAIVNQERRDRAELVAGLPRPGDTA